MHLATFSLNEIDPRALYIRIVQQYLQIYNKTVLHNFFFIDMILKGMLYTLNILNQSNK